MKITKTLCLAAFAGLSLSANAQNVWTGTTTPTTTSGNVGINVTTPASRLDIQSATGTSSALKITNWYSAFTANSNIMEVYSANGNLFPPPTPQLITWLNHQGIFGLRSLSNTGGSNRMVVADASGNLKIGSFSVYANPAGSSTDLNSFSGITNIRFIDAAAGYGGGNLSGGLGGLYLDVPLNISSNEFVSGYITCSYLVQTSDRRLKENIKPLSGNHDKLFNINSYSYTFKNDKDKNAKLHFGFIAQDVEKEFPNLVNIDEKGSYALNYIEFIPLLLEELKAQKAEIGELKEQMAAMEAKLGAISDSKVGLSDKGQLSVSSNYTLAQNAPNPFNRETVIKFNIGDVANAFIGIYDLNGKQLQRILIHKGEQQVKVSANSLQPGTYVYNLVADGQLVDSKKMIVID